MSRARAAAAAAIVVVGLAVVYTLALLLGTADHDWAYAARGVIHLGELAAVVAVALCGAAGPGALGRIGLVMAAIGTVLLAVAEVVTVAAVGLSDTLFAIAPLLVGVGLVLAGIAVLRAGVWRGAGRYAVLVLGIYVFVVLTPAIIVSGGPPAAPALWALLGWQLLWLGIAAATLVEHSRERAPAR